MQVYVFYEIPAQNAGLFYYGQLHSAYKTKKSVEFHQTPFPSQRVGSGDETTIEFFNQY